MNSKFAPLFLPLAVLSSALLAQAPAGPKAPEITFQQRSVAVSGITAQGQVVWFSVAREVAEDDVATLVRRSEVQADDDGDGKLQWELDRDVPLRSIWVAVDLATGRVAMATPQGYPLRRVGWRGRGRGRDDPRSDRVEDVRIHAEVLLVRPGQGAWRLTVGDGGRDDDDGTADGKVAAALDHMRPVAGSAGPPARFDPRDVVVLIDPDRMELTVEAAAPSAGAAAEAGR